MHLANREFWKYCAERYPRYFTERGNWILELGSFNVNGTVRDHFKEHAKYIGVDWCEGPCVDVVSLAHKIRFDNLFDTVISASMLEHDPYWIRSIVAMVSHMKPDGLLLLSWGAALNEPHCEKLAEDQGFHALPAGHVLGLLERLGLYVHEFHYEGNQFPLCFKESKFDGMGEVCLVAFNDKKYALGERHIDKLVPQDSVSWYDSSGGA